jgi:hypothetical protein
MKHACDDGTVDSAVGEPGNTPPKSEMKRRKRMDYINKRLAAMEADKEVKKVKNKPNRSVLKLFIYFFLIMIIYFFLDNK